MQINRKLNFTDEGHMLYINGTLIKRWRSFTDEGHVFTLMVCEQTVGEILQMMDIFFEFNLHGMQTNIWRSFTD